MLGGSGAIETLLALRCLEERRVPPNLNLDNPDPECTLPLVRGAMAEAASPLAVKNSFAFGGDNAVLVLRRWEPQGAT